MKYLIENSNKVLVDIEKCKQYIHNVEKMNDGFILKIIKSNILKKINHRINNINKYIFILNDNKDILNIDFNLNTFCYKETSNIIYKDEQMNTVVYEQLDELDNYLTEIEFGIKIILEIIFT